MGCLKNLADKNRIILKDQKTIASEAGRIIADRYNYKADQIKLHFDRVFYDTQNEIYKVYLKYEEEYCKKVINLFIEDLIKNGEIKDLTDIGKALGKYFKLLDQFFMSLAQSRRSRAGKTFEAIHNGLLKELGYLFDEQKVINGKPDFIMPS